MLLQALMGDVEQTDKPCPMLWYAVESINNTIYILNN